LIRITANNSHAPKKTKQDKTESSRWKDVKLRATINEMQFKRTIQRINETELVL
jgi:hypothetical protein